MKKNLIFRILGNDLQDLHGNNQTLKNLEFTLKNEEEFPDTEKMYLLNRIYDLSKKNKILELLNRYDYKHIDLPFSMDEFKKIEYPRGIDTKINNYLHRQESRIWLINYIKYILGTEKKIRSCFFKKLYAFNMYMININGARNFCLNYGKNNGYEWIFVLDSNAYFTHELFNNVIDNIKENTEYICIPQIRLSENNFKNEQLLNEPINFNSFIHREPQIAFKNTSKLKFNEKIPYGTAEKAELLRVLQVPGPWDTWNDNELYIGIKDRKIENVKYQILSKVIRLNSHNSKNNITDNFTKRIAGLNYLINEIKSNCNG
ncbi:hypothetical protein [Gaetbulibacter aestuarii]|uniref:Uncharacterized protein n=1 Tax=Gaetbulibacter aestuarii TaxID=1502358 RepID=A0ABW7N0U9_9FLAO